MYDIAVLAILSLLLAVWITGIMATKENFLILAIKPVKQRVLLVLLIIFVFPFVYEIGYTVGYLRAKLEYKKRSS